MIRNDFSAATFALCLRLAKSQLLFDVQFGRVPSSVASFADLAAFVDSDGYGNYHEFEIDGSNKAAHFWIKLRDALDSWIRAGSIPKRRTPVAPTLPITSTAPPSFSDRKALSDFLRPFANALLEARAKLDKERRALFERQRAALAVASYFDANGNRITKPEDVEFIKETQAGQFRAAVASLLARRSAPQQMIWAAWGSASSVMMVDTSPLASDLEPGQCPCQAAEFAVKAAENALLQAAAGAASQLKPMPGKRITIADRAKVVNLALALALSH